MTAVNNRMVKDMVQLATGTYPKIITKTVEKAIAYFPFKCCFWLYSWIIVTSFTQ